MVKRHILNLLFFFSPNYYCSTRLTRIFLVFFFQAEDGIRDATVTGVQTCALPISRRTVSRASSSQHGFSLTAARLAARIAAARSEERRVGKECRSRRSPYH